jgi:hypothetical protein
MKKLFIYTLSLLFVVPFITSAASFTEYPDMELGFTGSPVMEVQKFLNTNGYTVNEVVGEPGSLGYEGTYFGKLTQKALSLFQTNNNITPAQGYFGKKTKDVFDSKNITNVSEATISLAGETYSEDLETRNLPIQKPLIKIKDQNTSTKKLGYFSSWYPLVWNVWIDGKIKYTNTWDMDAGSFVELRLGESNYETWTKNAFLLGTTMNNDSYVWKGEWISNYIMNGPTELNTRIQSCAEKSPKHVFFKDINALEKKFMQLARNKGDSKLGVKANWEVMAFAVEYSNGGICATFADIGSGGGMVEQNKVTSFFSAYKEKSIKNMYMIHGHDFNSLKDAAKGVVLGESKGVVKNILMYKEGNYYTHIPSDVDLRGSLGNKLSEFHKILNKKDIIERAVSADGVVYEYDQPKTNKSLNILNDTDTYLAWSTEVLIKGLNAADKSKGARENYNNADAKAAQDTFLNIFRKELGATFRTYNIK